MLGVFALLLPVLHVGQTLTVKVFWNPSLLSVQGFGAELYCKCSPTTKNAGDKVKESGNNVNFNYWAF